MPTPRETSQVYDFEARDPAEQLAQDENLRSNFVFAHGRWDAFLGMKMRRRINRPNRKEEENDVLSDRPTDRSIDLG